jgi:hypothetical protein
MVTFPDVKKYARNKIYAGGGYDGQKPRPVGFTGEKERGRAEARIGLAPSGLARKPQPTWSCHIHRTKTYIGRANIPYMETIVNS